MSGHLTRALKRRWFYSSPRHRLARGKTSTTPFFPQFNITAKHRSPSGGGWFSLSTGTGRTAILLNFSMPPKKPNNQLRRETIRFLTQDEARQLFSVITKLRDRAAFLTAYRHGLRASEVGLLQRSDLDLKSGRISIQRLKGSHSGVYPSSPISSSSCVATSAAGRTPPLLCSSPTAASLSTALPSGT